MISLEPSIASVRTWLRTRQAYRGPHRRRHLHRVAVLPDFRGPQGVWTKDRRRKKLSNIHLLRRRSRDPKEILAGAPCASGVDSAAERGHAAIVELERRGKLHALITQNIDDCTRRRAIRPSA